MDKKKTLNVLRIVFSALLLTFPLLVLSQEVDKIVFCGSQYEYGEGKDSITLFLKLVDKHGKRNDGLALEDIKKNLVIHEDGIAIPSSGSQITKLNGGVRIPADYTFSVLIDLGIPEDGKHQIADAIRNLVESVPDSCVFLSFFGDSVTNSQLLTKSNYQTFGNQFQNTSDKKHFYGALYAKLTEFSGDDFAYDVMVEDGYSKNKTIKKRAQENPDKNVLFIFTEGSKRPDEEELDFARVALYQQDDSTHLSPKVYAFYYTDSGSSVDDDVVLTLQCVTGDGVENVPVERRGAYRPSDNMSSVLTDFQEVVNDAMYDYAFTYKALPKAYSGKVNYRAEWKKKSMGMVDYTIGTAESPWPTKVETGGDTTMKYLIALLVALLVAFFFFLLMKILVPLFKSKSFATKYYKRYVPQENVKRLICSYCRQEVQEGQKIVTRCKHVMHVRCWKQNGYKCAEYGQNCRDGVQRHIEWNMLFSRSSMRDVYQIMSGILAGLISWVVYELTGRGFFDFLAKPIVNAFFTNSEHQDTLHDTCVTQVSAFLTIGFLLAFFLSLIFRFNDEYREKNWKVWMRIIGLSLLTGAIGLLSFALGSVFFCVILSAVDTTYIPWYCSLPAYIIFSIATTLSLTIKSTIPLKSALIGGACSALIGFFVLYFTRVAHSNLSWLNMLLNFVIYGSGLGASLVTVRKMAEKYFLYVKSGIMEGKKIPIHKWMNAIGGGNRVSIGMTGECEIQMNWEKTNKVAKKHAELYIDQEKMLPVIKPLASGVIFNTRAELPINRSTILSNSDTFQIGDTTFQYVEE